MSEEDRDVNLKILLAIYNRVSEEVFYRRKRTSFITSWSTTLFSAIIGFSFYKDIKHQPFVIAFIIVVLAFVVVYFVKNSEKHETAMGKIEAFEDKFSERMKEESELYESLKTKIPSQEFGTLAQGVLVALLAIFAIAFTILK